MYYKLPLKPGRMLFLPASASYEANCAAIIDLHRNFVERISRIGWAIYYYISKNTLCLKQLLRLPYLYFADMLRRATLPYLGKLELWKSDPPHIVVSWGVVLIKLRRRETAPRAASSVFHF